jgi:hypothetical protein
MFDSLVFITMQVRVQNIVNNFVGKKLIQSKRFLLRILEPSSPRYYRAQKLPSIKSANHRKTFYFKFGDVDDVRGWGSMRVRYDIKVPNGLYVSTNLISILFMKPFRPKFMDKTHFGHMSV